MKDSKKIDGIAVGLTLLGYVITGVSLLVGHRQAKIHRQQDIQEVTNQVLKQLEKK